MKKNLTELVFVLDMSGSMDHLTDDTIGGFNSMLREQQGKEGDVLVTTYLFNNEAVMLHDRVPVEDVKSMTQADYRAGGCTALVDALGDAIKHIVSIHRYAREEDIPENTVFVITTDGMENASHKYSTEQVRRMVKHEQEKYGWEFIYLAANIDAAETAQRIGIAREMAVDYCPDAVGTMNLYKAAGNAVSCKRMNAPLAGSGWRDEADRDFAKRKK